MRDGLLSEAADGCCPFGGRVVGFPGVAHLHDGPMLNALSIDVEDYYQVEAFASVVDRSQWGAFPSRVAANTERLLGLLERRRVRATWFVLGWAAQRFPQLVRRIHDAGHELATHGFWHRLVYRQTPEEFAEDIRCSLTALSAAAPDAVIRGYRAPSFSMTSPAPWRLESAP